MTAHEFFQDGIRYVPSRIAAKSVDLAPDYISRMCREGLVLATWHRGAWYVNERSLTDTLAARRLKQEEQALAQSEILRRERELAEAAMQSEPSVMPIDTQSPIPLAPIVSGRAIRVPALPAIALSLFVILAVATSVLALPDSTRERITQQLPSPLQTYVADLRPQLPWSAPTQLASAATSFPAYIQEKIRNVFCWWLECEQITVEVAEQRPRPGANTQANVPLPSAPATSTNVVANAPTQAPESQRHSQPPQSSQPPAQTILQQPVIERVIETRTIAIGISEALLDSRLLALGSDLTSRMNLLSAKNANQSDRTIENIADALQIDELTNTILHSPTIDGGTITGATIVGEISNVINSAVATILSLTANELVATNATTTNATTTNLYVAGTATFGSGTGILQSTSGVVAAITNGSAGQILKIVGGVPAWGTDLQGSGGGSSAWATTSDSLAVYTTDPTQVVLVGTNATSTTGTILEVVGASLLRGALTAYNAITAPIFTATSTSASSTLPRLNITGSLGIGSDYVTDITGSGLALSSGALTLDTSGDWSGTLGSYSPSQPPLPSTSAPPTR